MNIFIDMVRIRHYIYSIRTANRTEATTSTTQTTRNAKSWLGYAMYVYCAALPLAVYLLVK